MSKAKSTFMLYKNLKDAEKKVDELQELWTKEYLQLTQKEKEEYVKLVTDFTNVGFEDENCPVSPNPCTDYNCPVHGIRNLALDGFKP